LFAKGLDCMKGKRVLPPVYFFAALVAMAALHFYLPFEPLVQWPWNFSGGILILAGVVIVFTSVFLFVKAKTTIIPFAQSSRLVTKGFYKYTRNPMYLGMVFILVGVNVCMATVAPAVVILAFVWILNRWFIDEEEKMMEEAFDNEFLEYKSRVRRWI